MKAGLKADPDELCAHQIKGLIRFYLQGEKMLPNFSFSPADPQPHASENMLVMKNVIFLDHCYGFACGYWIIFVFVFVLPSRSHSSN